MAVRLIIFDLGGVLVNHEPQRLIERIAQETGLPAETVAQAIARSGLVERFELGRLTPAQLHDGFRDHLQLAWSFEEFVAAWNGMLSEKPDTTSVIERLHPRYRLMALSNTNSLHDAFIRRTWPVFRRFHHWVTSYEAGCKKPEPRIYEVALREAGVAPQDALYLDDIRGYVEEAGRLGIPGRHLANGARVADVLRQAGVEL